MRGFTLIELMVVVIVLAALAMMVVPRLTGRSEQAKIQIARTDVNSNIPTALKLYELDNGFLPSEEQGLEALMSKPSSEPVPGNWNGPYLDREAIDPWKNEYHYKRPGAHNTEGYDLYSAGPDGVEETDDDVGNWR